MSTTNTTAPAALDEKILSSIVANGGDLGKLTQDQKLAYYSDFCNRLGLDPLSQPFLILRLNGKDVLYCGRAGVQQLSKLHKVSHKITARDHVNGCYAVTAQASTPDARSTESIGVMPVENLKGDALSNAMMKAESKAKRRATLDLLGLGMLDESAGSEALPGSVVEISAAPAKQAAEEKPTPVADTPVASKPKPEPKAAVAAPKEEKAPPTEQPANESELEIAHKIQAFSDTVAGFTEIGDLNDFIGVFKEQAPEVKEGIKATLIAKVTELNVNYNNESKKYEDIGRPADRPAKRDLKWFQERIGKAVWMQATTGDQYSGRYLIANDQYPAGMFGKFQDGGVLFSDWVPTPAKSA